MNHVDLARFEFDYDTTWTAFFLDADLNIYSRYGGRDERNAEARMSRESLLHTMDEVRQTHDRIRQARVGELAQIVRTETHPVRSQPNTPEDIPLLRENHQGCVHCHQVQEYRYLQAHRDNSFDRRMVFRYPLPEELGIGLKSSHGHQVQSIAANSPAANAGLLTDDVIRQVNDVVIRSEYDIRWALQHADDANPIAITVSRDSSGTNTPPLKLKLQPAGLWRKTELGWRKSLRSVPLQLGFLGYTLTKDAIRELGFPEDKSYVKVVSLRPPGLGKNLGLQKGDLITAVGGQTGFREFAHFKSKLLELYQPGDTVELEVLREGKTLKLTGTFPEWFTDETSVP